MSKSYYYLVASLPELTLEDNKLSYSVADFKSEFYPYLSSDDQKLIDLFYLKFDNANVLKLIQDKDAVIDLRGNFSLEQLNEFLAEIKEGGEINPKEFPSYLSQFIVEYYSETTDKDILWEDRLASLYYAFAAKCSNKFIASWFDYNSNINNVLVALIARKYKWDISQSIVGDTEICESLRTSGARDFGLSAEVDYLDNLIKISEISDLVEREKKLDLMRWNWMDETTFFNYFTIEKIFVFLIQLEMIERWLSLDKERGNALFRNIIDGLKNEVQIPAEFR